MRKLSADEVSLRVAEFQPDAAAAADLEAEAKKMLEAVEANRAPFADALTAALEAFDEQMPEGSARDAAELAVMEAREELKQFDHPLAIARREAADAAVLVAAYDRAIRCMGAIKPTMILDGGRRVMVVAA